MPQVLVVDDSLVDRRLATGLIEKLDGWQVAAAEDVPAALHVLLKQPIDLVVTDLQMPEMSGLDLVKEMRKQFPQIPVVLMTAQGSEEIAVQALQSGAASYVPKRLLAADLVPTLRRVLSAASDERTQQSLFHRLRLRTESYIVEPSLPIVLSMSRYLQNLVSDAWGLDKTERLRLGTALEEALMNALYHGTFEVSSDLKHDDYAEFYAQADQRSQQAPYCQRRIEVEVQLTVSDVRITIRDEGPGFDVHNLPDPSHPEHLDRPSGRGVMLMRSFMNEVRYNDKGNEVTLVKRRF